MKVLITGSSGFVGRHLWTACAQRAYTITGVDIDPTPGFRDGGVEMEMDCRRLFATDRRFDLVFHCAATVGGRATIDGNPLAVATNLSLDAELFNWAMRTRPGRVVYFSSSAAYPVDLQNDWATCRDLVEGDIRSGMANIGRPDQTYGWAKITGEMLAEQVNSADIPVHVFRPFSGYGSDQSRDYPFRAFLDRAHRRDDPFVTWGNGQQVRDWIHIDDIVAAVFAAIDQDVRGPVNLCTGVGTSFTELATMVTETAGYAPRFEYLTDKPVGVQYRVGSSALMRSFYEPTVTLAQGIAMAQQPNPVVLREPSDAEVAQFVSDFTLE